MDGDPLVHSSSVLAAKGVALDPAVSAIEAALHGEDYGDFMTFEEYARLANAQREAGRETLEFTNYVVIPLDGWCYAWPGSDMASALSRRWATIVCEASKIENSWELKVHDRGHLLDRHCSSADPIPAWSHLKAVLGTAPEAAGRGNPETVANAFGVPAREIAPYFYFVTAPEEEALSLLSDGFCDELLAPVHPDDLRRPTDGWHVLDLVRRLGAGRIDDVMRNKVGRTVDRWTARPRKGQPPSNKSEEDLSGLYLTKARQGLESSDPRRQLSCAQFLFDPDDENEAFEVIRSIARREDSLGAEAVHFLASLGMTDMLWQLFRQPSGLPPLERAALLRNIARVRDRGMRDAVSACLGSDSRVVQLEAIEAAAHIGAGEDELVRLAKASDPMIRAAARAAVGAFRAEASACDVEEMPPFADETVALRYGTLALRHSRDHLRVRIDSLNLLADIRRAPHGAYEAPWRETGTSAFLKEVIARARELDLQIDMSPDVDENSYVWVTSFDTEEIPFSQVLETAIRSARGHLSIRANGSRLAFRWRG